MKTIASSKDRSVRIRFSEQILKKLDESAANEGRSRNTEINIRLAESLGLKKAGKPAKRRGEQ